MWAAITAFLIALFVPPSQGEPSVFENIWFTLVSLWDNVTAGNGG